MKNIYSLLIVTLLLISCGNKDQSVDDILATNDLEQIRKNEI